MPDSSDDSDEDITLEQRRRELKRTTKRKADASPTSPKKQKAPSHDDDDVVCTGCSGVDVLADCPHSREDCRAVRFLAGQEHEHCPKCYCYVCDAPAGDCTEWSEHCKASHKSAEWRLLREQRKGQQSAPPAAAQRNDAPPAGPPRSGQREADRASAATTRGSAPERGRPVELVDLTSDGDEVPAEPSHPPARRESATLGRDGSASASSSTPRTARSGDAVDLDKEPDEEEVVTMQMRKVELGTFDCGACQVAFTEKAIRFYTDEAPRFQPKGYPEEIELEMDALISIQIDKQRGLMCVTGFFGYDVPEHYSSFAVESGPQNRALFHFNTSEGDGVWSGSDRDKWVKSLMRLSQHIKSKTHFNPERIDFAAELQRYKRRQASEEHVPKPLKPAAGRGSRVPPQSSRGCLLQAAASGGGSGGAGRGSGSAGTGRFPGPGQRVDGKRTHGAQPIDQFLAGATPRPVEREGTNPRPQRSTRRSSFGGDLSGIKKRGVNKKAPIHPRPHPQIPAHCRTLPYATVH